MTELPDLKTAMSIAQFKAIVALLAGEWTNGNATSKEITSERIHTQSHYFGDTRYHTLSLQYDGDVIVDQCDTSEKYQQRVTFEAAEIEPILRQLLIWHFAKVADISGAKQQSKGDDWDNQPFGDDPDLKGEDGPPEDLGTPDGVAIFTLNDGGFSIAAERFSPESEAAFLAKQEPFEEGIKNAYSPRPEDEGPYIL